MVPHPETGQAAGMSAWRPEHSYVRAAPKPRYVPLILSAAAVLMWLLPSDGMLGFGSFVGAGIGFIILWDFLFRDNLMRLTRISAMGFLLGYSGGTLNTWLTLPRAGYSLASRAGLLRGELCRGVAATILASACLLIVGELFESPILDVADRLVVTPGLRRVALFGLLVILPVLATGKLQQTSSSGAGGGVVVVLFGFLVTPTVILSTIVFLTKDKGKARLFWGAVTVILWLLQLDLGRRDLVYSALITVALARHAGYQWSKLSFRQILVIGLGMSFLFLGFLTYQLVRVASYGHKNSNLVQQLSTVGTWVEEGRAWKIATTSTQKNLQGRTFVVAWFSDLLELSSTMPTAHGRDFLIQTEEAIPSAFIPNKPKIQEEGIASEQFDRNYSDQANSLLTAGVIDFGLAGVVVYPLVLVFCMSVLVRWLRNFMDREMYIYGLIIALMFTIATEIDLGGFEVGMRNVIIISIGIYLLLRLPSVRLRAEARQGELS